MLSVFAKDVYQDAQFVITTMSAIIAMNAWYVTWKREDVQA